MHQKCFEIKFARQTDYVPYLVFCPDYESDYLYVFMFYVTLYVFSFLIFEAYNLKSDFRFRNLGALGGLKGRRGWRAGA
jgi:hypothetical protein